MPWCNKCNRFLLFDTTTCNCRRFECNIPDWDGYEDDDDWPDQYACDAEEAARKYTEAADDCEYDCLKHEVVCKVRDPQDDSVKVFSVHAETSIEYYAEEEEEEGA